MEASHKTHRPHIKVGKDEEEEEEEEEDYIIIIVLLAIINIVKERQYHAQTQKQQ